MENMHREKIEAILGQMQCPQGFRCADTDFKKVCRARDIGSDTFLECLEESALDCVFAISFSDAFYCNCPLRVYIAKRLNK